MSDRAERVCAKVKPRVERFERVSGRTLPGDGFASLRTARRSGGGVATEADSLIVIRGAAAQSRKTFLIGMNFVLEVRVAQA